MTKAKDCKKGIILAGGTGSRLYPLTLAVNKQLMPIYDKPALYYPLATLMLAGIRDILIVSSPKDMGPIKLLLGDGKQFGVHIDYQIQEKPVGLPDGFIVAEKFINNDPIAMILGDNFFYGHGLSTTLLEAAKNTDDCHIFLYTVKDPSRYGVATFDEDGKLKDLIEKPTEFISPWAVTGLYFFPADVCDRAKKLAPSNRGELEITDLIKSYLKDKKVTENKFGRGNVWLDVGTPEALLQASHLVEALQNRQNLLISSPEEIAWRMGYISLTDYKNLIERMPKSLYRESLEMTLIT